MKNDLFGRVVNEIHTLLTEATPIDRQGANQLANILKDEGPDKFKTWWEKLPAEDQHDYLNNIEALEPDFKGMHDDVQNP